MSDLNNLYVIRNDEPFQPGNDVEQIEGGYGLAKIDDSQPQDSDEPGGKEKVERRFHQRFHLKENAFALIRSIFSRPLNIQDKSMGGVAFAVFNAKPARLGKIHNISMGGLMFEHIADKTQLNRTFVLDILSADCGFYLADIPFEIEADVLLPVDIPDSPFKMRQVRLQFQKLSTNQQTRLNEFLLNHGTKVGEMGVKN